MLDIACLYGVDLVGVGVGVSELGISVCIDMAVCLHVCVGELFVCVRDSVHACVYVCNHVWVTVCVYV